MKSSILKYTQKDVDNRTDDRVCWDCGFQFLTEPQKMHKHVGMMHGKCGLCGKKKFVSHISDWNYLRIN